MRRDYPAFFLVTLFIYLLTVGGHLYSPDAEIQFRTTQALATSLSVAIEPLGADGFATMTGRGGKQYAQYGLGVPIVAVPFYYFGELLTRVIPDSAAYGLFWPTTQYHGNTSRDWLLRMGVSFFNQVVCAVLATLVLLGFRLLSLPRRESFIAAALYAFATNNWAHSRTFFSEPLAACLLLGSFLILLQLARKGSVELKFYLIAGALAGLSILVRKDSLLFFPGLGLMAGIRWQPQAIAGQRWAIRFKEGAFFTAAACGGIALHLLLATWQFGAPFATGYEDQPEGIQFSTPFLAGAYGFLFSLGKGMFFFSPALVLSAVGWPRFHRRFPVASIGVAVCCFPFFIAMCKWQNWAGGWCWGPRHIFQIFPFLAFGLVGWVTAAGQAGDAQNSDETPRELGAAWRVVTILVLIIGAGVQIFGSSQSYIDYYIVSFRMPDSPPTAYALYTPGELAEWSAVRRGPDGKIIGEAPAAMAGLTAPINDSIYIPQTSQWAIYPQMWRAGYHDLFWLHLFQDDHLPATAPRSRFE